MKMTKKQIRKDIRKEVKDFGDELLKAKRDINPGEDPYSLEPLSDFFLTCAIGMLFHLIPISMNKLTAKKKE